MTSEKHNFCLNLAMVMKKNCIFHIFQNAGWIFSKEQNLFQEKAQEKQAFNQVPPNN